MDLQLKGKKALITGSTAGIGYAIAKLLAKEGASVIINGRKPDEMEQRVADLREETQNKNISGIAADFAKKDEVNSLIEKAPEVEILINNVGIYHEVDFTEISDDEWFETFEINVMSGVRLARHYLPKMMEKKDGRIIFISSESALNIPTEMVHYGMSKTAQLAVSRGLARLSKGSGVTVNSVLPGPTLSRTNEQALKQQAEDENKDFKQVEKEFIEEKRPTSLIQRFATVEEVANLVAYTASPLSSATSGAALRVDGGVSNYIV